LVVSDNERRGLSDVLVKDNAFVDWAGEIRFGGPNGGPMFDTIRFEDNSIFRDLGRANFDSQWFAPVVDVFSASTTDIEFNRNKYSYINMHPRMFTAGGVALAAQQWAAQVEPDATFNTGVSPPSNIGLDSYFESLGRSGGWEEFMAAARRQSRQSYDPELSPKRVYSWMSSRLPQ
jgi:hypothetical protein